MQGLCFVARPLSPQLAIGNWQYCIGEAPYAREHGAGSMEAWKQRWKLWAHAVAHQESAGQMRAPIVSQRSTKCHQRWCRPSIAHFLCCHDPRTPIFQSAVPQARPVLRPYSHQSAPVSRLKPPEARQMSLAAWSFGARYAVKSRYDSIAVLLQLDQVMKQLQRTCICWLSSFELGERTENSRRSILVRFLPQ
jgi:hypothetical protein